MKITTETIKKKYFTCERCGLTWQEKMWITKCPRHGEFCIGCAKKHKGHSTKYKSTEIHIICPECDIELTEDKQIDISPYVEIKKDFVGVWMGSIST